MLTATAKHVLERRYLLRDPSGRLVETPQQMFSRVARTVAEADARYGASKRAVQETADVFVSRMTSLEFLPNSPTLMNAGRPGGQLAACFVVPVTDDTDGIFQAVAWAAKIQKTGGGTGFAFSQLRPSGDRLSSTSGVASGPVSFMQVFDVATDAVKQGGTRRGANMAVLRVDHPDILSFIACKLDPGRMQNFNLSVGVTDEFMNALEKGADYELRHPGDHKLVGTLSAPRVFDAMVNAAWATGDPGVVFLDTMNAANPTPALGAFEATNPCGEQPLLPFESCTLGSINLARFIDGKNADLDWARLADAISDGVHFLDNVIDVNEYPIPQIAAQTRATRKIGLGVMGWADALVELSIPYDDPFATALGERVATFLAEKSEAKSRELGDARGVFPAFAGSKWSAGSDGPIRNATTTTVAPTGTISMIAGCSSGIEPHFALAFERHVLEGDVLPEVNAALKARCEADGVWNTAVEKYVLEHGTVRGCAAVPKEIQTLFPTAHEIDVDTHVGMQAAFQRHVHAAVSKTINLPNGATRDQVGHAYRLAYSSGCKGVTVYRDGSRATQVLTAGQTAVLATSEEACPECGGPIRKSERCSVCLSCGFSVCA